MCYKLLSQKNFIATLENELNYTRMPSPLCEECILGPFLKLC